MTSFKDQTSRRPGQWVYYRSTAMAALWIAIVGMTSSLAPLSVSARSDAAKESSATRDSLRRTADTAVIVGFDIGREIDWSRMDPKSVEQRRNAIAAYGNRYARYLSRRDVRITHRYANFPAFVARVNERGMKTLGHESWVTSISENERYYPQLGASVPLINADDVWDAGYTGNGLRIAVIDSGVDASHPFLAGKVDMEACFSNTAGDPAMTTTCPNGTTQQVGTGAGRACADCSDHGTHVAGIAAGFQNREKPGVARGAGILAIQVFALSSDCSDGCSSEADIIAALDFIVSLSTDPSNVGTNIAAVNISLGGDEIFQSSCDTRRPMMAASIAALQGLAIPTVVAAGNDGRSDGLASPACQSGAFSVGATDDTDTVADFSNSAPLLRLLAPGVEIRSSVPGGVFDDKDGTSMAAPHVAGAIALIKEFSPQLSVNDMLNVLRTTGKPVTDPRNGLVRSRIDVAEIMTNTYVDDGTNDIVLLVGGEDGPADYRMIVAGGPSDTETGGIHIAIQDDAPDDANLHSLSAGRTVDVTVINDINGDQIADIAYLKGGANGPEDYRLIVVSGPTDSDAGGVGITTQETAPDDPHLHFWAEGRTVGVATINDLDGDTYEDIVYLKGGPADAGDYRLVVVSGPTPTSSGGAHIVTEDVAADDSWLNAHAHGRTQTFTVINDLDNDGYQDIAYLKGGANGPHDFRLIVVSGPTGPGSPGGVGIVSEEIGPDDSWLNHWSPSRSMDISRIDDINNDTFDDIAYVKGGPDGPDDFRVVIVAGPQGASSPGGQGLVTWEAPADDFWLNHWTPGLRHVRISTLPDLQP